MIDWIVKYEATISNKFCWFYFPVKHDFDAKIAHYLYFLYEVKLIEFIKHKIRNSAKMRFKEQVL